MPAKGYMVTTVTVTNRVFLGMIAERRNTSSFNEQFLCYFYPYLKDYEQILWNVQTFYLYLQPKMI
jgi:hypothetical protein